MFLALDVIVTTPFCSILRVCEWCKGEHLNIHKLGRNVNKVTVFYTSHCVVFIYVSAMSGETVFASIMPQLDAILLTVSSQRVHPPRAKILNWERHPVKEYYMLCIAIPVKWRSLLFAFDFR